MTIGVLILAAFAASLVEFVEALTIVLAIGLTRGWRSALAGVGAAAVALAVLVLAGGYAVTTWIPRSVLTLVVGTVLLIFGLQWLRKAVLRASGRKALHDEEAAFAETSRLAADSARSHGRWLDGYGFLIAFKGTFVEGVEVAFIVVTFGSSSGRIPVAAAAAGAALIVVAILGLLIHRPLTAVPENLLKYGVGIALATFGTFWAVDGLAALGNHPQWIGGDLAIPVLAVAWWLLSRLLVTILGRRVEPVGPHRTVPGVATTPARPVPAVRPGWVRAVRAFGQFWYGLIVGDDWRIAAAVVGTLGLAAAVLAGTGTNGAWWPVLTATALLAAFATTALTG